MIAVVLGTRPEIIKLSSVIKSFLQMRGFSLRELLGIAPNADPDRILVKPNAIIQLGSLSYSGTNQRATVRSG